jgi:hypothetical protein
MNETVEPAMSEAEWEAGRVSRADETLVGFEHDGSPFTFQCVGQQAELANGALVVSRTIWGPRSIPALIALANAALPVDDPRKITREWVAALYEEVARGDAAERLGDNAGNFAIDPALARRMVAVLASYLRGAGEID